MVSNIIIGSLAMGVLNFLPAVWEIYTAATKWNEPCKYDDDPSDAWLKEWLVADGAVAILFVLNSLGLVCVLRNLSDPALIEYHIHKERDGAFDPEMDERLQDLEASQRRTQYLSNLCGCCPLILLIVGWVQLHMTSDESCNPSMRTTTFWVLIYKIIAPFFFCCCCLPCMAMCGMAQMVSGMEAGAATDEE